MDRPAVSASALDCPAWLWAAGLKLRPVAYRRASVAPRLQLLLRDGVEVMARLPLGGLQLLPQLPRLLLGLPRGPAGVPQGALGLAHALLQLPVSPLDGVQALLQLAASLLLLKQRCLDRGAHELCWGGEGEDKSGHQNSTSGPKTLQLMPFSQQPL